MIGRNIMKNTRILFTMFICCLMMLFMGCDEVYYNLDNEAIYTIPGKVVTLDISGGVDVVVDSTLAQNKVLVLSNTDDFSKLVLKEENGTLVISDKRNIGNKVYKLHVPALNYEALVISGGSDFEWDGCSVEKISVIASGGADCEMNGRCTSLSVVASGGADVDMEHLLAEEVTVVASGGSDVSVHAAGTISVTASGGSDIYIAGNPRISGWKVSGGADVHVER
jgi:hypothetical protein